MKRLTGGDSVVVRPLYAAPISFINVAKIVMLTNNPPDIKLDDAIISRTRFIPFNKTFETREVYDQLKDKTGYDIADDDFIGKLGTIHLDEVFTYFVNGAIKYFQRGKKFNMPPSFVKSCKEFVEGNDHLKTFIQERCEKNSSYSVKTSELLSTFNEWATEMSVPLLNCRTMKKEMGQKGYVYKKIGVMYRY